MCEIRPRTRLFKAVPRCSGGIRLHSRREFNELTKTRSRGHFERLDVAQRSDVILVGPLRFKFMRLGFSSTRKLVSVNVPSSLQILLIDGSWEFCSTVNESSRTCLTFKLTANRSTRTSSKSGITKNAPQKGGLARVNAELLDLHDFSRAHQIRIHDDLRTVGDLLELPRCVRSQRSRHGFHS